VPSKMYGILAAGKPIVAVAPRETDAVALGERLGFGVGADPDRPEEIASVVRDLASEPERIAKMSAAARQAAKGYDRARELENFLRVVTANNSNGEQRAK